MAYIDRITEQSGGFITRAQLEAFTFDGHAITLIDPSRDIRNPATLPATLSILTNPRSGYADQAGPDGFPRYSIRTGAWAHARLPRLHNAGSRLRRSDHPAPTTWFRCRGHCSRTPTGPRCDLTTARPQPDR